ncbi:restriction endonuclease subunit S [Rhizobium brockwellii]
MVELKFANLADLAAPRKSAIAIGPFGSRMKADVYVEVGVPVIRGTNIGNDRALKGDWVYVTDKFADGISNCVVEPGDLVFPHRGSIGEVALVEEHHGRMVLSSSMMKFSSDPTIADPTFLYYFFRSPAGRNEIMRFGSQVGTPGIGQPLASLRQFQVPLLELAQQANIGNILRSLDDKIELNRRMNETLEAMAQAIFRDWFVDFGPTRRKLDGATDPITIMGGLVQDAARAQVLADLFPAKLGDDGLPEGWSQKELLSEARLISGGTPKTDRPEYWGGGVPWASAKDVSQCGETYLLTTERNITDNGLGYGDKLTI